MQFQILQLIDKVELQKVQKKLTKTTKERDKVFDVETKNAETCSLELSLQRLWVNKNREPGTGEERGREADLGNKPSGTWQMIGQELEW